MEFGAITSIGKEVLAGIMTFLVYGLPFMGMAILLVIIFFVLKKRKVYAIDCIVDTISDNNLVRGRDFGGIVKNSIGVEEFRFRKRRRSCAVPNRKFWVIQDNGKYCIHFYRYGDDDFAPVEIKPKKGDVPVPVPGLMQRITSKIFPVFAKDDKIHVVDVKEEFKGISFTPIKSETKQFLMMKAKEIVHKNRTEKSFERWKPVIMWGGLIVAFIFLVIWYFKYASVLANKELSCVGKDLAIDMCKEIIKGGGETIGFKSPF